MPERKKQHYVPQFYLRFFSDDKKHLFTYNIKLKKSFRSKINRLCQSSYFYGDDELEKALGIIENKQSNVLKKLISDQNIGSLTREELYYLRSFVLLQRTRTKEEQVYSEKIADELISGHLESDINLHDQGLEMEVKWPKAHLNGMECAIQEVEEINDLYPILIKNESIKRFMCSDAPIVFNNYVKVKGHGMKGIRSPGLQIFCPLNEELLLLLIDSKLYTFELDTNYSICLTKDSDVDAINKLQFFNCLDNLLFSKEQDISYLEQLHSEIGDKTLGRKSRIAKVETKKHIDGTTSEYIKMYESDVDYKLKLSFLKLNHEENRKLKGSIKKLKKKSKIFNIVR